MRSPVLVILILMVADWAHAQRGPTTADLAFMTGCWKFERGGRVVEEHWMAPAGGSVMGISRTVVNGKVTEYEFVQIRDLAEGLTFIAKPSNQPEAKFVATSKVASEVTFENPAHDFPQRIRYRADGNALNARIEGTVNGKTRAVDFPYVRTSCIP